MQKVLVLFIFSYFLLGYEKRALELVEIPNVFSRSQELILEAVLNSKAKINGKWYQKGDRILNYDVKEIRIREVVLEDLRNKPFVLKIGK